MTDQHDDYDKKLDKLVKLVRIGRLKLDDAYNLGIRHDICLGACSALDDILASLDKVVEDLESIAATDASAEEAE